MKTCQNILVVEDDEDIRELVVDTLRAEGYAVESARDGAEGLRRLETMPVPTLVFLDLMMPSMNGWEFLDAQKKNEALAGHKIVTISAVEPTASLNDATPLAVDDAISKPLSLERILAKISKFCRVPEATTATA